MKRREKSAIEMFEEATHLLRRAPASALAAYYAGALPFVLALLFFWSDMSQSAFGYEHVAPASLALGLLFGWMVYWQGVFVQRLRAQLSGAAEDGWRSRAARRLGFVQIALQSSKFIALPAAALILVPFASVYAFYQNLMALPEEKCSGARDAASAAWKQAALWQQQNWIVLTILGMLNVVAFVNIGITILAVPYLLKTLLGIETVFTRSGLWMFNTTLLAVTAGLTYLAVNPLAKAVYLLRCFYGESLETGEDLRAELKIGASGSVVARAVCVLLIAGCVTGSGQPTEQTGAALSPQELNRAIDDVIHRPEFTWRMPRAERPTEDQPNWFVRATENMIRITIDGLAWVRHQVVDRIGKWLDDWLRRMMPGAGGQGSPDSRRLRALLYGLLAATAIILAWLIRQVLRGRKRRTRVAAQVVAARVVDLRSEELQADAKPLDQWLELARDCMARQEFRLALRALYLAGLAQLADGSLISIHRSKSNQDYARELRRKARGKAELQNVFAENMSAFEQSWYGMHDVDQGAVERFENNLARMRACASEQ